MTDPSHAMQSSTTSSSSEVVYGAGSGTGSETSERVMTEKVQMLASAIYKEFESMIQKCGEENVKDLMSLVVNILESLDLAYLEKEEHLVDLEMLKEENEQLLNQYERERQMRKAQDHKCLEIEESLMEQNKELEAKIDSLESIVRMLELKAKNATDHANRLEEREVDQRMEFDKLHERYNELLRTHIEHVERTKFLMGADKFDMMQSLPSGRGKTHAMAMSMDTNVRGMSDIIGAVHMSQSTHTDVNLANHISNERDWHEEFGQSADFALTPREDSTDEGARSETKSLKEVSEKEEGKTNAEKSDAAGEAEEDSLTADLTGALVDPAEFASAGMGREVENLIRENTELLETKNALNIVKNDLIARVDELSSEQEILREDIRSLEMVKLKLNERIRELEAEVKQFKEKQEEPDPEEDVPMAQRKRFTRVEMARVLMERNQYKEKLMELQEAVKYTEMQRQKKMSASQPNNNGHSRIWDFFSGLFGETQPKQQLPHHRRSGRRPDGKKKKVNFDLDLDSVQERRKAERRQQYKAVSQHMKKDDESRTQAYGWSIPASVDTASTSATIPVPVCCRPLLDRKPSLKIWCAAAAILRGGKAQDGAFITDNDFKSDATTITSAGEELRVWERSSLVWICSSNERSSYVTVLDANNPNHVLECFPVCDAHLLCITSAPGMNSKMYQC
ncbi:JNK-associated leucine-zipper protein [Aphelenchoides avenae]|nr:JNK-associated leucine-zipper protein [Aphelenchus avenae]